MIQQGNANGQSSVLCMLPKGVLSKRSPKSPKSPLTSPSSPSASNTAWETETRHPYSSSAISSLGSGRLPELVDGATARFGIKHCLLDGDY